MATLNQIVGGLTSLNDFIARIGKSIAWVLVTLMVATILLQVVCRYVFNSALPWPEEVARAMMIWMMALVASGAYRKGMFVSITMVPEALPQTLQRVLRLVLLALAFVVLVQLFSLSVEFFERGFRTRAASFNMKRAWIYLAMPVCFGTLLLANLELLLITITNRSSELSLSKES
ncbi:2,3-diketo-L-gulonate TRAP transporter small permease protein YiaM [Vibrio thalassae]|uniref:TRAP transporter small permease protein n=1 Tax=Vibrio thalassae TaxID=1243014 RepID=A0A240EPI1_9VIBR|nr:TRAP transporter small permease subunit [Vibrio thalassae]SNX49999.1 2,3-diketo-L-gulonate TRAP transporter small permease protein YiaM [Vibrio thalassae]